MANARLCSPVLARARLLLVAAMASQLGCYTYAPATLETVPDGAHVRALITPEAERQLLATFGVQQGRTLSGDLEGRVGDQINLLVPSVPIGSGPGSRPLYQQVTVSAADVLRVDIRRVDLFRTGVMVAGAAAAAAAVVWEAFGGGFFTGTPSGDGPAESQRGWGISIPISWP